MAYTKFTGTPEEFKRLQREQGLALRGQDVAAYDAAQSSIANAGMDQRSQAQAMAAQDDLRQLEEKGRRNYESVQAHSAAEDGRALERQRQAQEADRRAALAESWRGNPARSWDEAADRYNSLNITSKASEWAETARQRQAVADAAAKETRDRHMRWSAGAMTALTRANDPNDKDAQGQLSVALEDIGNSLAQEQGLVFDAKKGIQTRHVNGELEATLTWTTEDGQTVTKTFSPSSLRKAYKGEALDTVLRMHWADMVEKDRKRFEGSAKDQADAALAYAKAAEIAQRVGLDASKQEFEQMCILNGIPVPDGKGGYSMPGGGGARSGGGQAPAAGQDFYGYGDYGKLQQAALNEAKELFSAAAASGNPITWAEAKKQALDGLKSDYEGRFGGSSSGAQGAGAPVVENAISAVNELAGDEAPRGGASPSASEKKKSEDLPSVAPGGNESGQVEREEEAVESNATPRSAPKYSTQVQEITSAIEEASRPLTLEEVQSKTPARGREYVTQATVDSTNASRKSNAKATLDKIDKDVRKSKPVGDGTFKIPNAVDDLEEKIFSSLGLVPGTYATKAQIDKAIEILNEMKKGPSSSPSTDSGGDSGATQNPPDAPAQDGSDAGGEETEGLSSEDIDAAVSESGAAGGDEAGASQEASEEPASQEDADSADWENRLFELLRDGAPDTESKEFRDKYHAEVREVMKHVSPEKRKQIREAAYDARVHDIGDEDERKRAEVRESNARAVGGDVTAKVGYVNDIRFGRNGQTKLPKAQADQIAEFVSSVEDFGLSEQEKSEKVKQFVDEQMDNLAQSGNILDDHDAKQVRDAIRRSAEQHLEKYREHKERLNEKHKVAPRLTESVKEFQKDIFANRGLADSLFDESQCKPRTDGLAYEWAPDERNAKNLAKIEKELQRDGVNNEPFQKTYNEDGKLVYVLTRKQRELLARYFAENLKTYDVDAKLKNSETKIRR